MKLFEKLRPSGETAAALAEAIDRATVAAAEAEARVADLRAGRGRALLAGGSTAERHEGALRDALGDSERLAALAEALREKHAEAERRELRQRLEAMASEAEKVAKAAAEAIAREYPKLAGQIAALLAAECAAISAIDDLHAELARAPGDLAANIALPPTPRERYAPVALGAASPLGKFVQLPRLDQSGMGWAGAPHWWPPAD